MTKRNQGGRPVRAKKHSDVRIELRVTAEERARYQRVADRNEISLSEWIRNVCSAAAQ